MFQLSRYEGSDSTERRGKLLLYFRGEGKSLFFASLIGVLAESWIDCDWRSFFPQLTSFLRDYLTSLSTLFTPFTSFHRGESLTLPVEAEAFPFVSFIKGGLTKEPQQTRDQDPMQLYVERLYPLVEWPITLEGLSLLLLPGSFNQHSP